MKILTLPIHPSTTDTYQFVNITGEVKKILEESHLQNGLVVVFTQHTTSSIVITEDEKNLQQDIMDFLAESMGSSRYFRHDDRSVRPELPLEERKNGWTHLQSIFLGTSQSIPFINGEMSLGKWQSIFFFDFDGPHEQRNVIIQVIGE